MPRTLRRRSHDLFHGREVVWDRDAAEKGVARAQAALGGWYEHGIGGEKNLAEAVAWYRKAVAKDEPLAQNNLGKTFSREANLVEATKHLAQAVHQSKLRRRKRRFLVRYDKTFI